MNAQKGFTLIELMIVVAIIGILAAIAIPAYQNYTKRAHVSEGLSLASGAKAAVTEYYSSKGEWPSSTGNTDAGLASASSITGNAVKSVAVNASRITITYNTKVTNNATLILQGSASQGGSVTWTCEAGSTLDAKYLPANCR
ncbi:prepilin-type N-terminal cleavage/methylation domain-containing protein [Acinetobacter qingfengensis]|uniref:Prepilin-type N-terminal cleavage/methylation domain-containing protein n=1 Tax=Acinetobacter qingfengensis TaxID=1262585 RepID=A0A1E7R153_9GAMM|nr:pilin [Acinetobacter qingfengensis]KAA8733312.1 prepilin-type N-terminal cleavage/methylation domain-containing protein [Acinetobacter qingfengensis]OEY93057.1 prepilin-type N-terminal cleavage/methylation domain-containing protein [Acinetobacter qingfengensis]